MSKKSVKQIPVCKSVDRVGSPKPFNIKPLLDDNHNLVLHVTPYQAQILQSGLCEWFERFTVEPLRQFLSGVVYLDSTFSDNVQSALSSYNDAQVLSRQLSDFLASVDDEDLPF